MRMKRGSFIFAFILVMTMLLLPITHVSADVNDFQFSSFTAKYLLAKTEEGQSQVTVTETFVAEFPNYQQNKGMVRAVPIVYQDHPVQFDLISVKRNGQVEPIYAKYTENHNQVVETGTDEYLLGAQEYEFKYQLTNVTQSEGDYQEFYWNIIGDQFSQPFLQAKTEVVLSPAVEANFTGEFKCYAGNLYTQVGCKMDYDKSSATITAQLTEPLPAQSSLTVALQFNQGTFKQYQLSFWQNIIKHYILIVFGVASLAASIVALYRLNKIRAPKSKKALIPEYLPPDGLSIMEVGGIVNPIRDTVISAELIDLAVRHNIKIIESEDKQLFGTKKRYTIEILSLNGLQSDEQGFLQAFVSPLRVGARYTIKSDDYKIGKILRSVVRGSQSTLLVEKGYLKDRASFKTGLLWLTLVVVVSLGVVVMSTQSMPGPSTASRMFFFASSLISFVILLVASGSNLYTEKGRQAEHYIKGLKMYIKLAEADRLKYLQSPQGAKRDVVNTDDQGSVIRLYERLLPYAVFFGLEKEWVKVLEVKYQDQSTTPTWYSGSSVGQGLMLGGFVSGLNSTSRSSFSAPSSSSGSGISGGSAGGGGGGGGGGGR